mmetsp:Transcript_21650/g.39259  ORF Transcript_21650/g.39259 Transcript_21650/m.39259 type:complete len:280 (+) Transcript_21650:3009-3848(+)
MSHSCQGMNPSCNIEQPLWSMINSIGSSHVGQQGLCSTDIGSCLVATNVLFSRLHGHSQTRLAGSIHRHSNDPSWHFTRILIGCGQESSMRSPKAHWNSKSLCGTHGNIGTPRGRRCQFRQGHEVSRTNHHGTRLVNAFGKIFIGFSRRFNASIGIWILNKSSTIIPCREIVLRMNTNNHVNSQLFGTSLNQSNRLRVYILGNKKFGALSLFSLYGKGHLHGLGRRRRFIQQRGDRHGQSRQVDHHGLKIEQHFQSSLRDFCLVGSVRRVPTGIFQHVS